MKAEILLCAPLLAAAVLVPPDASAQVTGSRMGHEATQRDAGALIVIIADCIAARRPGLARRWLELLPGSREEYALLEAQQDDFGVCASDDRLVLFNRELLYSPRRLRGPVAFAMVRHALARAPAQSPVARDTEPWFAAALAALPADGTIDRGSILAQEFGHCVMVRDWAATRALVLAREGSTDEGRAFRALAPMLGPCLPQGLQLEVSPKTLRDYLAEPIYHALAPAPAAPARH